jgi:hypothetical protein
MRSSTTCRRRSTCRRSWASIRAPRKKRLIERPAIRRRAVCGARVQDHDRPVRRSADVHSRLLRRAHVRVIGLQRDEGPQRTRRPSPQDAREQARGESKRCMPATSPRQWA